MTAAEDDGSQGIPGKSCALLGSEIVDVVIAAERHLGPAPLSGEPPGRARSSKCGIMPMSTEECRAHAEACERMAESLGPDNYGLREPMREVANQWRRLAKDAEARSANRPLS